MDKLILIGLWHTLDPANEFVHPHYLVDKAWDATERSAMAEYLRSGRRRQAWMGYSWCRFRCDRHLDMGTSELTDGKYAWPEGLAHYVKTHAVRPPEEFVAHARANNFSISIPENDGWIWHPPPMDGSFWRGYCSKYPKDFPARYAKHAMKEGWTPERGRAKRDEWRKKLGG